MKLPVFADERRSAEQLKSAVLNLNRSGGDAADGLVSGLPIPELLRP